MTLIGAGDGANPETNTILQNTESEKGVVYVDGNCKLALHGFRITGGQGRQQGGGIFNNFSAILTLMAGS